MEDKKCKEFLELTEASPLKAPLCGTISADGNTIMLCALCRKKMTDEYRSQPHEYKIGDYVKTAFFDPLNPEDGEAEHMWVCVTMIDGKEVRGILRNNPAVLTHLKLNDNVEFSVDDISGHLPAKANES